MRLLPVIAGCLLSWVLGAVVVRLGLDWADTFPYSEASERRYLGVAGAALLVAIGGSVATLLVARRRHRRDRTALTTPAVAVEGDDLGS
ncbi:hypothetical protein [Rhodococcus maanshanensis]|uniref:Uncharacterized protein n=1 Tax=Rhodococcus maanshanensis TaxID=183556 RepID=A0A1H7Y8N7_9NOCA|nr:hypothetical protein [Rhodococcus maanshanensis]SEM41559.1 hypothetical protein SAMN05444583_1374 [Rhodococcus maanshanensis]